MIWHKFYASTRRSHDRSKAEKEAISRLSRIEALLIEHPQAAEAFRELR